MWKTTILLSVSLMFVLTSGFHFGPVSAETVPAFKFYKEENSPKSSFGKTKDPLSGSGEKVQMLRLDPAKCINGDCDANSARALMHEDVYSGRPKGKSGQPTEAWYSWEIYLPPDFPYGPKQARGGLQFAEFKHTNHCASVNLVHTSGYDDDDLYWRITKYTGASPDQVSEECKLVRQTRVARMRDLVGRWTKFELFVRWSREGDGQMKLFINGEKKMAFEGATCLEDCVRFNPFYYGIYLSNAPSRDSIKDTYVLFKNVDRAASRGELAVNDD